MDGKMTLIEFEPYVIGSFIFVFATLFLIKLLVIL